MSLCVPSIGRHCRTTATDELCRQQCRKTWELSKEVNDIRAKGRKGRPDCQALASKASRGVSNFPLRQVEGMKGSVKLHSSGGQEDA